jgi:NAD+ synthase (glutamine-hydrolysing)
MVRSRSDYRLVPFSLTPRRLDLQRPIEPHPFVPADAADLAARCEEILTLQVQGLMKRLAHTHCQSAVIGLSGGLDSTLALLVTARAFDALQLPRSGIIAVTMPGFGTTDRTYGNALQLARSLAATLREIPIRASVSQHFADIGHPADLHDVTYENSQARERTQILMDIANQTAGLVIGTGDLSELALGWATYNGDHMSMYAVNCSVPKTLVRHLVRHAAGQAEPHWLISCWISSIRRSAPSCCRPVTARLPSRLSISSVPMNFMTFFCTIWSALALHRPRSCVWRISPLPAYMMRLPSAAG